MTLEVAVTRTPELTVVEISGLASIAEFTALITAVGNESKQYGDKRVLVNLLGVEGTMAFTEHFQLGHQVARQLRHLDKLASVVPEDKITRTSEKMATSLGMQLRVFTRVEAALTWLAE
jgi:hypothetical protein